jgi:hypothetical protein
MTTYRIRGRVINDSSSGETVGLKVVTWDKDERFDDRLGVSRTNSEGEFEVEFSDEDFQRDYLDRDWVPDIYFQLYRGNQLLGSTEDETIPDTLWKYEMAVLSVSRLNQNLPTILTKLNGENSDYSIELIAAGYIIPEATTQRKTAQPIEYSQDQIIDILPIQDQVSPLSSTRTSATPTDRSGGSIQQSIDNAFDLVLCRKSQSDPKAFIAALNQTFVSKETNGRKEYTWNPCKYQTSYTDLGGSVSGAQASLHHQAKTLMEPALKFLNGLYALNPAVDPQNASALKSLVQTEIEELVNELGTQGGPRQQRVESLFQLLLGDETDDNSYDKVGGHLQELANVFGLVRSRINTVDEENNYSNYLIIRDSLISLRTTYKVFASNSGGGAFIGTQLVLLSQALSVVAESVQETYQIMNSVFLGPAERQAVYIDFTQAKFYDSDDQPGEFPLPDGTIYQDGLQLTPSMTLEKLLSWTLAWSSNEAPNIIKAANKLGMKSVKDTAEKLMILIQAASFAPVPNTAFRRAGVTRAMRDLAFQVYQVKRLAEEVIPPLAGDRNSDADDLKDLLQDLRDLLKGDAGGEAGGNGISRIIDRLQQ